MLTNKCSICEGEAAKYKCPTCRAPYCSVVCCKKHKEGNSCQLPVENKEIKADAAHSALNTYSHFTEDTVQPDKLELLGKSPTLRDLLQNPHLQRILQHLDSDRQPKSAMEDAMQEPIFLEFANVCMDVLDSAS
ncbi:zinc finger HIT domain-containing protein 3 [Neocloeon triangulifer]|uniref:zinc finger HIT domain-containing protein 3 n=1 Tax=Neocloeon triangulifer TaxID=2078957 RepID=UPI00286EF8A3|nr:zinc finger HIT domain-containing protein 3 [Neocloeon triangulifer]